MAIKEVSFPRSLLLSAGIVLTFLLYFGFWALARPVSPEFFTTLDTVGRAFAWLLTALLCLAASPFSLRATYCFSLQPISRSRLDAHLR